MIICFSGIPFAGGAEPPPLLSISQPAVTTRVTAAIEGQLAAFRADDVAKAYGFAAQALRAQIPREAFARMVERNYPEVWRSTRVEIGLVRDNGAQAAVVVRVFAKGAEAAYDYTLFKEADEWRIGGVVRHEPKAAKTF